MKKIIFLFPIFFICLFLCSCDFEKELFDMTEAKVVSITPSDRASNVAVNSQIVVTFSTPMDTTKTANEFSLSSDDGMVYGIFSWDNEEKVLTFSPLTLLKGGREYTIEVNKNAEDKKGNDLDVKYTSVFYVDSDMQAPKINSYFPLNNSLGVANNQNIEFVFSDSMDINSVYDGIVISPPIDAQYSWSNNNTQLQIIPYNLLKKGTTYSVTVNKSLKDKTGNYVETDFSFSFTVGSDFTCPQISSVKQGETGAVWSEGSITNGIEKQGMLIVSFDEIIDLNTITDSFVLSPSCDFYLTNRVNNNQTEVLINLLEDLESDTNYQLTILKSITDNNNNTLERDFRYKFVTNGPNSQRPKVLFMTDGTLWPQGAVLPGNNQYWQAGQVQPLTFLTTKFDNVYVIFAKPVSPTSINMSIECLYAGSGSPRIINPNWYPVEGTNFRVYKFDINGITSTNTYKLTLKGGLSGIKDQYGNYMEADYIQYVRF